MERDVTAFGGDVHVAPGARVGEEATAFGGRVTIDPGASVKARTSFHLPGLSSLGHAAETVTQPSSSPLLAIGSMLAEFALYFAFGLILLVFWPRRLERVAQALASTPARSTAVGMLGWMALPILTVLLVVTVVGIPLILVEVVGVLFGEVLGLSALALVIGRRLPLDIGRNASAANLALGTAALVMAMHLPFLGWLLKLGACVAVLGAVVSTRFGHTDPLPGNPRSPADPPVNDGRSYAMVAACERPPRSYRSSPLRWGPPAPPRTLPAVRPTRGEVLPFIEDDYPRAKAAALERKVPLFVDVWAHLVPLLPVPQVVRLHRPGAGHPRRPVRLAEPRTPTSRRTPPSRRASQSRPGPRSSVDRS